MHIIAIDNNKSFRCSEDETLFDGAKKAGIILEHSCLSGRCSSCKVMVNDGVSEAITAEIGLSKEDKEKGYILSCINVPKSDMIIEAEDLSVYPLVLPKIIPAKINLIEFLTHEVLKITLRLPPNQEFNFIPGQYLNIIKGTIKRSYSIANAQSKIGLIELVIKNYPNGLLSKYWFNEAKINDLLRIEGPKGTFFLRNNTNTKNIIFLATGTGIAPVVSILESMKEELENFKKHNIYLFWGVKYWADLFWSPEYLGLEINYYPVLSREESNNTDMGHVQNILLNKDIDLKESIVYACGSNDMIVDAKNKLTLNGLPDFNFYSDAFVSSN